MNSHCNCFFKILALVFAVMHGDVPTVSAQVQPSASNLFEQWQLSAGTCDTNLHYQKDSLWKRQRQHQIYAVKTSDFNIIYDTISKLDTNVSYENILIVSYWVSGNIVSESLIALIPTSNDDYYLACVRIGLNCKSSLNYVQRRSGFRAIFDLLKLKSSSIINGPWQEYLFVTIKEKTVMRTIYINTQDRFSSKLESYLFAH
jgi:hypothetical protein